MDGYPAGTVDLFVPLLVASGLSPTSLNELPAELGSSHSDAVVVRSDIPILQSDEARSLAEYLGAIDSRWDHPADAKPFRFRVVMAGRSFLLPPRRAKLSADVKLSETEVLLHSPFSPLSPSSSLFADGIINAMWVQKHQALVPTFFACFYTISSDTQDSALQDNRLKKDIGLVKGSLLQSGYRTRVAVVILDQSSSPNADGIQERLENIRKGTGLDPKVFFYIRPQNSLDSLKVSINAVLTALYPQAMDYYRDLGKHVRKKRGRNLVSKPTVPPTAGTSQTLSLTGWHVRYDYKAGVFALIRQEPDQAIRFFEQAYEGIMGPDVLGIVPSWSTRWNEFRLLADVIAIQIIRSLLHLELFTAAVKRWRVHRNRIAAIVEERGRGTSNYGWEAWEARWATVMAELIENASIPALSPSVRTIFLPSEKPALGDRLQPWELLHHPGYWHRITACHLAARRDLAHSIPLDDRRPPNDISSAIRAGGTAFTYDTYLCPEPHEECALTGEGVKHSELIVHSLMQARSHFQARGQLRFSAELALGCANELASIGAWDDVLGLLRPLWEDMSFRSEGWWQIVETLSWTLRTAAIHASQPSLVLSIDWELLHKKFTRQRDWHYSLSRSLEGLVLGEDVSFVTQTDVITSFISASFTFRSGECRAGTAISAQLSVGSNAMAGSEPLAISRLVVEFDGNFGPITLNHEEDDSNTVVSQGLQNPVVQAISLQRDEALVQDDGSNDVVTLAGTASLVLAPEQVKVYEMTIAFREQGFVRALSMSLLTETATYQLRHRIAFQDNEASDLWYGPLAGQSRRTRPAAHTLEVRPKPPKLEIRHLRPSYQFFTNEAIQIPISVFNAEDDHAVVKIEVSLDGDALREFEVCWAEREAKAALGPDGTMMLTGDLGTIPPAAGIDMVLRMQPAEAACLLDITIKVAYRLRSDSSTPILQSVFFQLSAVNAFEASFDLLPRLHPEPWPSMFGSARGRPAGEEAGNGGGGVEAHGIAQQWCLLCHFASFAAENLAIVGMQARVVGLTDGVATISSGRPAVPDGGFEIKPHTPREAQFDLMAQKFSIDDRGPVSLDIDFVIQWRRLSPVAATEEAPVDAMLMEPTQDSRREQPVNTAVLRVPTRFVILGTEPRVIASLGGLGRVSGQVELLVTVENGSGHFLTFGVGMEPSDEFAFAGPKQTTLHVLPVTRRAVAFRIMPLVPGGRFIRLPLLVCDKYFQKVLRILPTEGLKMDKDGLLLWIPAAADTAAASSNRATEQ